MNIDQLISEKISKRDSSSRNGNFHVTSLPNCPRGVLIARRNPELVSHDDRTLRVFECGHLFESFVVDAIPKEYLLATQEVLVWKELGLVGSCDIIIQDPDGYPHLLEIKSQNSQAFHWNKKRGGEANPIHVQQVSLYYSKLKEKYPNLRMSIVYISKDDLCIEQYQVEYNQKTVDASLARAKALKKHWDAGTLPEKSDPVIYDKLKKKWEVDWRARYCPVHNLCMENDNWESEARALVAIKNKKV
jgi:hypothetical protein